jgi:hypothetical protein
MSKKKWYFIIYTFDPETKIIKFTEKLQTKVMTKPEFDKTLKDELLGRTNFCWELMR